MAQDSVLTDAQFDQAMLYSRRLATVRFGGEVKRSSPYPSEDTLRELCLIAAFSDEHRSIPSPSSYGNNVFTTDDGSEYFFDDEGRLVWMEEQPQPE